MAIICRLSRRAQVLLRLMASVADRDRTRLTARTLTKFSDWLEFDDPETTSAKLALSGIAKALRSCSICPTLDENIAIVDLVGREIERLPPRR